MRKRCSATTQSSVRQPGPSRPDEYRELVDGYGDDDLNDDEEDMS